jgi:hypothetical protein
VAPVVTPQGDGAMVESMTSRFGAREQSKEDKLVLATVSLQEKQSPEQLLALANASARNSDFSKAKVLYDEYFKLGKFDGKIALDYASVLGMNGAAADFDALVGQMQMEGQGSEVEKAQANYRLGLRTALQANLFNNGFEESIRIGEMLLVQPGSENDAWIQLWLACAYGQKHSQIKAQNADDPALGYWQEKAVKQVERTVAVQPGLAEYVESLYDPAKVKGIDNDLTSLYPDKALEKLLADARKSKK